jgi:thiamine biosynthesis lipoprotein
MHSKLNRRRFMRIVAGTASCGVAGAAGRALADESATATWRGLALGNLASIEIRHSNPARATALLDRARAEIQRLESIMSLYRPQSALSTLNREGILRDPPLDLVRILSEAQRFGALSQGRFDVTVQPLWTLYAEHFSKPDRDPAGPSADLVQRATERVDYRAIEVEPDVIKFGHPGMQVTLNGIAQGYITDRVSELFRNEGLDHALVDLGEIRALGGRDGSRSWRAGIEDPFKKKAILADIPLSNNALATSGGYGFKFDSAGKIHHIFDPATGTSPHRYASVSVVAANATTADALATAANLLTPEELVQVLRRSGAQRALLVDAGGGERWLDA